MKELEDEFNASGGTFTKYKIGELFTSENGNIDIQQKHINGKGEYVVSSGDQNAGLIGRSDINAKIFAPNTITVDMFGAVNYRPYKYKLVTHARVFSLSYKFTKFTELSSLYLVAMMKYFREKFSYSNMASWKKIKHLTISLPTTSNGEIAFDHMESVIRELEEERIRELEEERIRELSAYLKVSGLENTELTDEENAAIQKLRNGNVKWKEFNVCGENGIFNIFNTHSIMKSQLYSTDGSYPYCTASEGNNSISGYVDFDVNMLEEGNSIFIGGKTLVISYQEDDYFSNDSHNISCYVRNEAGKSKKSQLFMVTALYKSLKPIYSWGDSISQTKIKKDFFKLPVTSSGTIDWDFMETLITAEARLAIRDVIAWRDKVIGKTKDVVASE